MAGSNEQLTALENQLGQQILPQVSAYIKAGNMAAAKTLLQQGLSQYQQGISKYQAAGGNLASAAQASLNNKALQQTISGLTQAVGLQYSPGTGAFDPNQVDNSQAKAAQYGLTAPLNPGDPYGMKAPTMAPAAQVQISPQLQQQLSGQGYSPETLANMNATAMQAPAAAGMQEMAQAKRALAQNGLAGSPAAAALQENVARSTGQAQVAAKNAVQTQNAQVGNQNQQFGIGQQTGINTTNANATNNQNNLQSGYNFAASQANQDELNKRYGQAATALSGG